MSYYDPPEPYEGPGCYFCNDLSCQQDCIDPETGEFWPEPEPVLVHGPHPAAYPAPCYDYPSDDDCPF